VSTNQLGGKPVAKVSISAHPSAPRALIKPSLCQHTAPNVQAACARRKEKADPFLSRRLVLEWVLTVCCPQQEYKILDTRLNNVALQFLFPSPCPFRVTLAVWALDSISNVPV
jgi:hypothetical protein